MAVLLSTRSFESEVIFGKKRDLVQLISSWTMKNFLFQLISIKDKLLPFWKTSTVNRVEKQVDGFVRCLWSSVPAVQRPTKYTDGIKGCVQPSSLEQHSIVWDSTIVPAIEHRSCEEENSYLEAPCSRQSTRIIDDRNGFSDRQRLNLVPYTLGYGSPSNVAMSFHAVKETRQAGIHVHAVIYRLCMLR